ncbi:hypothetical protein ACHAQK_005800 [Fusarium lateritium]
MDSFTIPPTTTIAGTVKNIREGSSRSTYINLLISAMKEELAMEGTTTLLAQTLEDFVGLDNMDLAMTTFNLHRFCFHNRQLTGNNWLCATNWEMFKLSNAWNIARYYIETLLDWKRLREFLELADGVRQLATAFASIPHPESYWRLISESWQCDAMKESLSKKPANTGSNKYLREVRFRLWQAVGRNPPGSKPTDVYGEEIDKDFFNRTLREFWHRELSWRGLNIEILYFEQRIPQDDGAKRILAQWNRMIGAVRVSHFCQMLPTQRLILSAEAAGVMDHDRIGEIWIDLKWDEFDVLGTQGYVACLPSEDDEYSMQFVLQLGATAMQLCDYWCAFEGHGNVDWYDGWYEKFPVSGAIGDVSLDFGCSYRDIQKDDDDDEDVAATVATIASITSYSELR